MTSSMSETNNRYIYSVSHYSSVADMAEKIDKMSRIGYRVVQVLETYMCIIFELDTNPPQTDKLLMEVAKALIDIKASTGVLASHSYVSI